MTVINFYSTTGGTVLSRTSRGTRLLRGSGGQRSSTTPRPRSSPAPSTRKKSEVHKPAEAASMGGRRNGRSGATGEREGSDHARRGPGQVHSARRPETLSPPAKPNSSNTPRTIPTGATAGTAAARTCSGKSSCVSARNCGTAPRSDRRTDHPWPLRRFTASSRASSNSATAFSRDHCPRTFTQAGCGIPASATSSGFRMADVAMRAF